jgi:hypothetical protein
MCVCVCVCESVCVYTYMSPRTNKDLVSRRRNVAGNTFSDVYNHTTRPRVNDFVTATIDAYSLWGIELFCMCVCVCIIFVDPASMIL